MDGKLPATSRPAWHATPQLNWMNDPNAWWRDADGTWHLWFQYRDDPPAYRLTHWGRLISHDALVWRDAGIAFRAERGNDVYSGCLVNTEGTVQRAYVTRNLSSAAATLGAHGLQVVEAWQRRAPQQPWQPGAGERIDPGLRDFRDPFVFRFGAGWRMLVAEPCPWDPAVPGPAQSRLQVLRSDDGLHWQPAGYIGPWDAPRVMWEVPQMLPLSALSVPLTSAAPSKWWLLIVSVLDRRAALHSGDIDCAVRWHLGTFDGANFEPADGARTASDADNTAGLPLAGQALDHGPDFYAACLQTPDGPDASSAAPALLAWMSHWAYARRLPFDGFAGGPMTLPRRLLWSVEAGKPGLRQQPSAPVDAALKAAQAEAPIVTLAQALSGWPCTVARALQSVDIEITLGINAASQAWLCLGEAQAPEPVLGNAAATDAGAAQGTQPPALQLHIDSHAGCITLHRAPLAAKQQPALETTPAASSDAPSAGCSPPALIAAVAAEAGYGGAWQAAWAPAAGGKLDIRLLIDGCCAEFFIDGGAIVFSALVFLPAGAVCTLTAGDGAPVQLIAARAAAVHVTP